MRRGRVGLWQIVEGKPFVRNGKIRILNCSFTLRWGHRFLSRNRPTPLGLKRVSAI